MKIHKKQAKTVYENATIEAVFSRVEELQQDGSSVKFIVLSRAGLDSIATTPEGSQLFYDEAAERFDIEIIISSGFTDDILFGVD